MPYINFQALYDACWDGDAATVSRMLPAGGTRLNLSGPSFQDDSKLTPLIAAAALGHTEIVSMILERAPNTAVDYMDAHGFTALLMATEYHHADIVRMLADRGGNVNNAGRQRPPPLGVAVMQVHADASPRDPDPDGTRQLATVKALLRLGAGTFPPAPLPPSDLAALAQPFVDATFPPKNPCATHNSLRG
jgi:hypothetical protein